MPAGHVRVVLGTDFSMPAALTTPAPSTQASITPATAPAPTTAAAQSSASGPMDSLQGGNVPCVK
jgi:hypothetical protein